ncbi:MAG: class I SAM-dependent methyltransferase [archaeon]
MNLVPIENKNAILEDPFFTQEVEGVVKNIAGKVATKYGEDLCGSYLVISGLAQILKFMDPRGKTVLDLGCGTINSFYNNSEFRTFEPWLARALHEYGANAVGVDLGSLSSEEFRGYSLDLRDPKALDFLADGSVDAACAFSLFDSPTANGTGYKMAQSQKGREYMDELMTGGPTLFQTLVPQLKRVLKPGAPFIYESLGIR